MTNGGILKNENTDLSKNTTIERTTHKFQHTSTRDIKLNSFHIISLFHKVHSTTINKMKASQVLLLPAVSLLIPNHAVGFTTTVTSTKNAAFQLHMARNKHFQSRPLVDFQKDLEAGKVR